MVGTCDPTLIEQQRRSSEAREGKEQSSHQWIPTKDNSSLQSFVVVLVVCFLCAPPLLLFSSFFVPLLFGFPVQGSAERKEDSLLAAVQAENFLFQIFLSPFPFLFPSLNRAGRERRLPSSSAEFTHARMADALFKLLEERRWYEASRLMNNASWGMLSYRSEDNRVSNLALTPERLRLDVSPCR